MRKTGEAERRKAREAIAARFGPKKRKKKVRRKTPVQPVRVVVEPGTSSGRLVVLGDAPDRRRRSRFPHKRTNHKFLRVRCDCGKELEVDKVLFRRGQVKSCGCLRREQIAAEGRKHRKHGAWATRARQAWLLMMKRCRDPKYHEWLIYGCRGIQVCERWHDFATFHADVGDAPSRAHTFGRLDEDGHYEPSNCLWETQRERRARKRAEHAEAMAWVSDRSEASGQSG